MSEKLSKVLKERQTAYLKGRMINDNIRAILASINASNDDEEIDGLLVSLDAKKAFDSVEHSYLIKCLHKFGLNSFVPIFETLYRDLMSDIIVNGEVVRGFKIKRGVKQGDALSCILFIMCMEPLLLNLEMNVEIKPLRARKIDAVLPKVYAYADDVNTIIKNDAESLQAVFSEYNRLTKLSGLELNADKTELMRLKKVTGVQLPLAFEVNYMRKRYQLKTCPEVKINGIFMQQDEQALRDSNVDRAVGRIDKIFRAWSRRRLSTLGKILLVKTFGISQIIFLLQSFKFDMKHFKAVNHLLYKFIWNKHYLAAKAPERIKREYVNKPIEQGGLGMLDIAELDAGLKLKAFGRLLNSKHPFLELIKENLLNQYFFPKCKIKLDSVTEVALRLLGEDRLEALEGESLAGNRKFLATVKEIKICDLVRPRARNSILVFNLRTRGLTRLGQLSQQQLNSILPLIENKFHPRIKECLWQGVGDMELNNAETYYGNTLVDLREASSKSIREARTKNDPICVFKLGAIMTPLEVENWGRGIKKLSSTKHKNTLLRVAHGEVYSKEKLARYGLVNDDICNRCGEREDLKHKLIECPYIKRIWQQVRSVTRVTNNIINDVENQILGAYKTCGLTTLTLHAEILLRILSLREDASYLVHPRAFVKNTILYLRTKEKKNEIKTELASLL